MLKVIAVVNAEAKCKERKIPHEGFLSWFAMAKPLTDSLTPSPVPELLPGLEIFTIRRNVLLTGGGEAFTNINLGT